MDFNYLVSIIHDYLFFYFLPFQLLFSTVSLRLRLPCLSSSIPILPIPPSAFTRLTRLALPPFLTPFKSYHIISYDPMHELLLFASVPHLQHHDLLQQLAGLTAMQPLHRLERHLIFKAYRKPGLINTRVGASQDVQAMDLQRLNKMLNGGMFHTQVVGPVSADDFGQDTLMSGTDENNPPSYYNYENQPWRLEFRDIPEAGTRSALTARLMANAALPKGNILPLMDAWGYR